MLALSDAPGARALDPPKRLRELLHDADEGLVNFDCISPLKPFLGPGFAALQARLSAAIAVRYGLPAWTEADKRAHKLRDVTAAASEAVHVAGWTEAEVREALGIKAPILRADPLAVRYGEAPWRPWPPETAARRFGDMLRMLLG